MTSSPDLFRTNARRSETQTDPPKSFSDSASLITSLITSLVVVTSFRSRRFYPTQIAMYRLSTLSISFSVSLAFGLLLRDRPCLCNAFSIDSRPPLDTGSRLVPPRSALSTRGSLPKALTVEYRSRRSTALRASAVSTALASLSGKAAPALASLFAYGGRVPVWQSGVFNAVLFGSLRGKLGKMLTKKGLFHAFALGTGLWSTLGWRGWTLCVSYLFLGQAVTKVKFAEKEKRGIAEGRGGRRGPENVWGSAATGLLCALASVQGESFLGISSRVYVLAFVASLATKLADTFASEIGKAYGKTTFLITTFARVDPGTEGAVSAEGTAAAAVGGLLLSLYGYAIHLIDGSGVAVSTVAAFLACNAESLIGATLQGKEGMSWMTNEVVNFINTLIGAGIAIAGGKLMLGM